MHTAGRLLAHTLTSKKFSLIQKYIGGAWRQQKYRYLDDSESCQEISVNQQDQAMAPPHNDKKASKRHEQNREIALLSDPGLPAEQIARKRGLAPSTVRGVIK